MDPVMQQPMMNDNQMGFQTVPEPPKSGGAGKLFLVFIIALLIGIGGTVAYFKYFDKPKTEEKTEQKQEETKQEEQKQEEQKEETKQEEQPAEQTAPEETKPSITYTQTILTKEQICGNALKGDKTITFGDKEYKNHVELEEDGAEALGDLLTINGVKILEPGGENYLVKVAFLKTGYIAVHYKFAFGGTYDHVTYYDKDLKKSCAIDGVTDKIDYNYVPSTKYKCSK